MENKDDGTNDDFKDMVVGDAKINGDNATVAVTNKKKKKQLSSRWKEDGDWNQDFTMGTLMKMGMDAKKVKAKNFDDIKNEGDYYHERPEEPA